MGHAQTFAPFSRESPFFGLAVPDEIGIRRQILAEPDSDLQARTWASLVDGTPIVTADKRGDGLIVLFHVTADTTWSNLPLSGLFVDMLRRITALAGAPHDMGGEARNAENQTVAPRLTLDGYGIFVSPPANARAGSQKITPSGPRPSTRRVSTDRSIRASRSMRWFRATSLPARFHATSAAHRAAGRSAYDRPSRSPPHPRGLPAAHRHRGVALAGRTSVAPFWSAAAGTGGRTLVGVAILLSMAPATGYAQERRPPLSRDSLQSALVTRLAYVVTGDAQVDETSKAGLTGLTQMLGQRTALQPGEPIAIDVARDELAFYPLLYWPIAPNRPAPQRGRDPATRRLHEERRNRDLRHPRRFQRPTRRSGQPGRTLSAQHAGHARHSGARTGAARPCADEDILSARRFPRSLCHGPDMGRGPAPEARTKRPSRPLWRRRFADHHHARTISPAPGPSGPVARRLTRSLAAIRASAKWRSEAVSISSCMRSRATTRPIRCMCPHCSNGLGNRRG